MVERAGRLRGSGRGEARARGVAIRGELRNLRMAFMLNCSLRGKARAGAALLHALGMGRVRDCGWGV